MSIKISFTGNSITIDGLEDLVGSFVALLQKWTGGPDPDKAEPDTGDYSEYDKALAAHGCKRGSDIEVPGDLAEDPKWHSYCSGFATKLGVPKCRTVLEKFKLGASRDVPADRRAEVYTALMELCNNGK